jgi:hypothetical protein
VTVVLNEERAEGEEDCGHSDADPPAEVTTARPEQSREEEEQANGVCGGDAEPDPAAMAGSAEDDEAALYEQEYREQQLRERRVRQQEEWTAMDRQMRRRLEEEIERARRAAADRVRRFKVEQGELDALLSELRDNEKALEALKNPQPQFSAETAGRLRRQVHEEWRKKDFQVEVENLERQLERKRDVIAQLKRRTALIHDTAGRRLEQLWRAGMAWTRHIANVNGSVARLYKRLCIKDPTDLGDAQTLAARGRSELKRQAHGIPVRLQEICVVLREGVGRQPRPPMKKK